MKYNPKACNQYAMLPEFLGRHPLAPESHGQGFLACMYELQEMLKEVTGMQGVALSPMAGAHGEFAGVAMIRAYHRSRGGPGRATRSSSRKLRMARTRPQRPCAAVSCARFPSTARAISSSMRSGGGGTEHRRHHVDQPSTLGVFERRIEAVARIVHAAGGLAVLRRCQPECHPGQGPARGHGIRCDSHEPAQDLFHAARRRRSGCGGGGGQRAAAAGHAHSHRRAGGRQTLPLAQRRRICRSPSPLSGFMGNAGVLLRAYIYMRMLGPRGHEPGRRIRHLECQLPAGAAEAGRF